MHWWGLSGLVGACGGGGGGGGGAGGRGVLGLADSTGWAQETGAGFPALGDTDGGGGQLALVFSSGKPLNLLYLFPII